LFNTSHFSVFVTCSFGGNETFDELDIATRMAAQVGANMHVVDVQAQDIADNFEDCVYHSETLLMNGNAVGKFLLSKLVREADRKCVLTGEGADEIFCGYPFFRSDYLMRHSEEERDVIWATLQKKNVIKLEKERDTVGTRLTKAMIGSYPTFLTLMCESGDISPCFTDELLGNLRNYEPVNAFVSGLDNRQVSKMNHSWDPVHTSMYLWSKSYLTNDLLVYLGDRCEMGHSVEGRLPFLDHELVELVNGMPLSVKLKNMNEKYILREAVKPYITKEVYERQKHPFLSPPESMQPGSPMYHFVQETLRSDDVSRTGILDKQKVGVLLDKLHAIVHRQGTEVDIPRLVGMETLLNRLVSLVVLQRRFNPTL
jgi:asparagine synthase (glutamine-hydrolysing)